MRTFELYFFIGFFLAIAIELLTRLGQSEGGEDDAPSYEPAPVSINTGTIVKTLLGVGFLMWLFKRRPAVSPRGEKK